MKSVKGFRIKQGNNGNQKKQKMKLEITTQEINLILASLGRMPYEAVFGLVEKIQAQAKEQAEAK